MQASEIEAAASEGRVVSKGLKGCGLGERGECVTHSHRTEESEDKWSSWVMGIAVAAIALFCLTLCLIFLRVRRKMKVVAAFI